MSTFRDRCIRAAQQFAEGFTQEGALAIDEARDALDLARRNFDADPAVRSAEREKTGRVVQYVRDNPRPVLKEFARSVADPIRAELEDGRPAAAAGRATVLLAGLVLPLVGSEKLMRVVSASEDELDQA